MPYTLIETLRQIDPYVQLNDGVTVATVGCRLQTVDCRDLTEYALGVDSAGRLLIYELNLRGFPIRPPVLVEQKPPLPLHSPQVRHDRADFGFSITGTV